MIRDELLSLLVCPETGEPLSGWNGTDADGTLATPSGRRYPVTDGIPNLLPDALRTATADGDTEQALKRSEMAARDAQVGDYDAMRGLRLFTRVELPLTLSYLRPEPGHLLLEAGCGTGRMTAALARRVRGIVCADFSRASLEVARRKLTPELLAKTLFIQADLSKLPLASGAFDRVGSFGVYEHIPTEEARAAALGHLARACRPADDDGRFAISAYRWGPPQSWFAQREGQHGGGIYFLRLTLREFRERLQSHFTLGGATEALLYYHLVWGTPLPPQKNDGDGVDGKDGD